MRVRSHAPTASGLFSRRLLTSGVLGVEAKTHGGRRSIGSEAPHIPGITYCFGGVVYVSLTNECNAQLTMLVANGPGFTFPPGTDFAPLPDGYEPTGKEAADAALRACAELDRADPGAQGAREVVFAGLGEPLVRFPAMLEALGALVGHPAVSSTRINTNGLVPASQAPGVAEGLRAAGVGRVCVQLQSADPQQHRALVGPRGGLSLDDACALVSALAAAGIPVDCTAVARPDVDLDRVKELALSHGAARFAARPYFP